MEDFQAQTITYYRVCRKSIYKKNHLSSSTLHCIHAHMHVYRAGTVPEAAAALLAAADMPIFPSRRAPSTWPSQRTHGRHARPC